MTLKITDAEFEKEVLKSDTPVLLDFWAEWCGPCRMLSPILDQVAEQLGDSVKVMKMNVDENPETPARFGVRGIPTLMIFKDGELKETRVGALPEKDLVKWVENNTAA